MYILEELWDGKIRPSERAVREASEYAALSHQSRALLDTFREELSPAGRKAFDAYDQNEIRLWELAEQDAFIRGVRFGARFMLDVIGEYHSQLPSLGLHD